MKEINQSPFCIFSECQATIESDLIGALAVDMKRLKADSNLPQVFAQMAVWDASALIRTHRSTIGHWLAAQAGMAVLERSLLRKELLKLGLDCTPL